MASYQSVVNINIIMIFLIGHKDLSHCVLFSFIIKTYWKSTTPEIPILNFQKCGRVIFLPFAINIGKLFNREIRTRSGPGFDPRSGQVSWVRFFRGFSPPVRQMSGNFRPTRSPNIILTIIIIHLISPLLKRVCE